MDGLAVSVDGLATRIEVRRLPDVVSSRTFLPAGLEIVNMLTDYLKVNRSLLVDRLASLQLIQLLGTVDPMTNGRVTTIKGRSLTSGFPSSMEITSEEVQRAISDALDHWVLVIAGSVKFYIQEQENTAASNQITLRGEFRHINDFSQRLESATGVRVVVEE